MRARALPALTTAITLFLLLAEDRAAQRYLPGLLEEVSDLGIRVRRPLGFEPDLDAPDQAHLLERWKGTSHYQRRYRSWFLSLQHHTGFTTEESVRESWEKYIRQEHPDWKHSVTPSLRFDGLPGLLAHAVPRSRKEKGGIFSGVVMIGGGRLFEVRIDVLAPQRPEAGVHFVEDFLRFAVLAPDRPGPLRIFHDSGLAFRLPRHWCVYKGAGTDPFTARHPEGKNRGILTWRQALPASESVESCLARALKGRKVKSGPKEVTFMEHGAARLAVAEDGGVVAAVQVKGSGVFLVEGTGEDPAGVEKVVADVLGEVKPFDLKKESGRAAGLAQDLKAALESGAESDAIVAVEDLTDLFDLAAVRSVVIRTLKVGTPRVKEAVIRALGARADNLSIRELGKAARRLRKKNRPTTLAAVYHALGRTAHPAATQHLVAGLESRHPVCVVAAIEALGARFGRPQKTFNALLGFWERLEAWARERPQLKSETAYPLLAKTVKSHVERLSGETFTDPAAAREWYGANRRRVGR